MCVEWRGAWPLRAARELCVALAFRLLTAALTWPYALRLRDAVVDEGDPYLVTWIMWWDYHQTFRDPLRLFHANAFYPLQYTLAFSEHCYGLALPFFPLYALGLRPLTVHAVALFLGFALSGYGAFRLARTLAGSEGVAWVAGIAFAFVPFRFFLMSQLVYLFAPWPPLLFEALVLFARADEGAGRVARGGVLHDGADVRLLLRARAGAFGRRQRAAPDPLPHLARRRVLAQGRRRARARGARARALHAALLHGLEALRLQAQRRGREGGLGASG